jgi:hypothetical protein
MMSEKIVKAQKIDTSMYLELNDNQAEAIQGGRVLEGVVRDPVTYTSEFAVSESPKTTTKIRATLLLT